ncbi:MAG: DUF5815 family protein [Halobacteriota archaeon]
MATPRVPGSDPDVLRLPCGEELPVTAIDLGMRDLSCACGDVHGVVMDVHPPSRFFPPAVVAVLRETIEPAEGGTFGTRHLMGMVLEELPDQLTHANVAENGQIGCQHIWVSAFDSRRLHEVIVDLVLELMEHAMTHAEDVSSQAEFASMLESFDAEAFVERYRRERDLDGRPSAE